ncbi:MAG: pyrroloquinoline quinone-dependent dehydrogenase [Sulfurifustis sp.]
MNHRLHVDVAHRIFLRVLVPAFLVCNLIAIAASADDGGWPTYGGDPGGSRYSPLAQITPANVKQLKVAWTFRTGDLGHDFVGGKALTFEATPILYDGALYFTTMETNVVAIDAASGKLRWRYDTHTRRDLRFASPASRGVSLWVDTAAPSAKACRARIFAPTLDARLLALDAATGKLCEDFGNRGQIDLSKDVRAENSPGWQQYSVTSPPAILGDKVIVGSAIGDNRAVQLELGIVRAFDARSGRLLWSWDPIPRNRSNPVYREWSDAGAKLTGAANAWAPLSVDARRKLVFVPTGSASPDYFGGERPGPNRWADSVVALNGDTGKFVWGQQLVHHNLWDYDAPAQPVLVDIDHDGKRVPGVIQATKTGLLFTFDRATGRPIFPIEERPAPQDAVPGETPSRTQPFPVAPPPLVRHARITPDDAWGLTFWDRGKCRALIERSRRGDIYTPPSTQDTITIPGAAGGMNWGGIAFDPVRQIAVVNSMDAPFVVALVPRAELSAASKSSEYTKFQFARQIETPYGMRRRPFLSPFGAPCVKPPWGTLAAVDMVNGTIKWQVPLGNLPYIGTNVGMPNIGGAVVTASRLIFIAATIDDRFRAFDIETGKLLWEVKLPAGGQASPMTYSINGRQYVVIAAGGHGGLDTTRGDYVIAYALPH